MTVGADDVLDTLPDGVVVADAHGTVTALNTAAARLLRVPDGVGKHLSDVVLLQDRAGTAGSPARSPTTGSSRAPT